MVRVSARESLQPASTGLDMGIVVGTEEGNLKEERREGGRGRVDIAHEDGMGWSSDRDFRQGGRGERETVDVALGMFCQRHGSVCADKKLRQRKTCKTAKKLNLTGTARKPSKAKTRRCAPGSAPARGLLFWRQRQRRRTTIRQENNYLGSGAQIELALGQQLEGEGVQVRDRAKREGLRQVRGYVLVGLG